MKIYDISQEVCSCIVYDGDTPPILREVMRTSKGDLYNLTDITMCVHNGTHIDAPFHFLNNGKTVDEIDLNKVIGECYVASVEGHLFKDKAREILDTARKISDDCARRILLKGDGIVTDESAKVFADEGVYLMGVESQSIGDDNAPMSVHKILLDKEVVLLEGIRLNEVEEGVYILNCAPLNIKGIDGSPCRAILIEH